MKPINATLLALGIALTPAHPLAAQTPDVSVAEDAELSIQLTRGESLETRVDGDLNGDGQIDTAFVGRGEGRRTLYILLAYREEFDFGHMLLPNGALDPSPLGNAELTIARGVLVVKDLTGGTTAVQISHRLRYDAKKNSMRLIGLDRTLYSRTFAHDGEETSWNLLTGALTRRALKLLPDGSGYSKGPFVISRKPSPPRFIDELPSAESP